MMSLRAFQHLSEENFDGVWGHVLANAATGGEEKLILVPAFSYHRSSERPKGHR